MPAGLLPKYLRVSSTRVSALEALMRHPGGWIGAGPCVNHRAAAGAGRGPEHGGRRPHIIRCRRVSWVAARRPHRGHVCGNPHRHRYVARAAGVVHHVPRTAQPVRALVVLVAADLGLTTLGIHIPLPNEAEAAR